MGILFDKVIRLHNLNAKHIKRGIRLLDYTIADNTCHLIEEAAEIQAEILPSGFAWASSTGNYNVTKEMYEEIGDTLSVLYHLIVRLGMSLEEVEKAACKKLETVFDTEE